MVMDRDVLAASPRWDEVAEAIVTTLSPTSGTTRIIPLSAGMLNTIFLLDDGRTRRVLRIRHFESVEYGQEFGAERLVYPRLSGRTVRVPELLHFDDSRQVVPYKFAIFEFVPGQRLDEYIAAAPASSVEGAIETLATTLVHIHQVSEVGFGTHLDLQKPAGDCRGYWGELFERELERVESHAPYMAANLATALPHCLDILDVTPWNRPVLVHGDMHGRNILVQSATAMSVIDWEASRRRTAPYDFAQLKYCNFRGRDALWHRLVTIYLDACGASSTDAGAFEAAVRVYQLFWHLRMGLFMRQFPAVPDPYFGEANDHLSAACYLIEDLQ